MDPIVLNKKLKFQNHCPSFSHWIWGIKVAGLSWWHQAIFADCLKSETNTPAENSLTHTFSKRKFNEPLKHQKPAWLLSEKKNICAIHSQKPGHLIPLVRFLHEILLLIFIGKLEPSRTSFFFLFPWELKYL